MKCNNRFESRWHFTGLLLLPLVAISSQAVDPAVTHPPARLRLPPFYKKHLSVNGYPFVASAKVNDYALHEAAYLFRLMLAERADLQRALVESGSRMIIVAHSEMITDVPEYAHLEPKAFWNVRARGFGGSLKTPYCSVGEENLLGYRGDPYSTESIFIHEMAHSIHLCALAKADPTFDRRLRRAYQKAIASGLWKNTYAAVNHKEYWAEGSQSWFNCNRSSDRDHNHIDTKKELIKYDPGLAALCREVYGKTDRTYARPSTRLQAHLNGYNPGEAPTFRWPKKLKPNQFGPRLKWQTPTPLDLPKSETGGKKTWIVFDNKTEEKLYYYWVSYQGELKYYGQLSPGATRPQSTFDNSTWVITNQKKKQLGWFRARPYTAHAIIPRNHR